MRRLAPVGHVADLGRRVTKISPNLFAAFSSPCTRPLIDLNVNISKYLSDSHTSRPLPLLVSLIIYLTFVTLAPSVPAVSGTLHPLNPLLSLIFYARSLGRSGALPADSEWLSLGADKVANPTALPHRSPSLPPRLTPLLTTPSVISVHIYPGITGTSISAQVAAVPQCRGVILSAYGSGNMPMSDRSGMREALKEVVEKEIMVVVISQCESIGY